ncbi:MAG: hypothetical protein KAG28_10570 [Cocleimonas sp.]|nr:hypothetical protein [Cocleimonas sp.]
MKVLIIVLLALTLEGCACNPKHLVSVFESGELVVDKTVDLKNIKKVVFKSFIAPTIVRNKTNNKMIIKGIEDISVAGYHTDECSAEKIVANMKKKKSSLGFRLKRQGITLVIETTGERRFIHHETAFSSLNITLPHTINYNYIASSLMLRK